MKAGTAALVAALTLAVPVYPEIPQPARDLVPRLQQVDEELAQVRARMERLQLRVDPLLAEVDDLKEKEEAQAAWWRRWWLKHKLSRLRPLLEELQNLDALSEKEGKEQFNLTSAVVEVIDSRLEEGLALLKSEGGATEELKAEMEALLDEKREWGRRLEEAGAGLDHPFQLVPKARRTAATRLTLEDQRQAAESRAFQLEAWLSLVDRERNIVKDALRLKLGVGGDLDARMKELGGLRSRIQARIGENEAERRDLRKRLGGLGEKRQSSKN